MTPLKRVRSDPAIKIEIKRRRKYEPVRHVYMRRTERIKKCKPARIIAYDFETTRIKAGTPQLKYLTAYSQNPAFSIDAEVTDYPQLLRYLQANFFTPENYGVKFVGWHSNRFDTVFMMAALLQTNAYVMRAYLTASKQLRGVRVFPREYFDVPNTKCYWELLDGAAMLGTPGLKLADFLETFAPDYPKLVDAIDFKKEDFNAKNPKHRKYAYRDSVGLWVAMDRAQQILVDNFNEPLGITMGSACIKIFMAHIPRETIVISPSRKTKEIIDEYVMRGGYCHCVQRYKGPGWKYDMNQAYAAAMRDAPMPAGCELLGFGKPRKTKQVYIANITAKNPKNIVPFYYCTFDDDKRMMETAIDVIDDTWLTSSEIEQLENEGWDIQYKEHILWHDTFTMYEFVSKLESIRMNCEGGPSGPIGMMIKGVGNHAYGKFRQDQIDIEFVTALECPKGYEAWYGNENDPLQHTFYRFTKTSEIRPKQYHQPQIAAFITAHVRMVVRRAILVDPEAFLYADTDCVIFSRDVTDKLNIHPSKYGAWKVEESGTIHTLIAKKVYEVETKVGGKPKRHAKGMNVRDLDSVDMDNWFEGNEPCQIQIQINNILKIMQGAEMYKEQKRHGTRIDKASKLTRVTSWDK